VSDHENANSLYYERYNAEISTDKQGECLGARTPSYWHSDATEDAFVHDPPDPGEAVDLELPDERVSSLADCIVWSGFVEVSGFSTVTGF
jgi:hypothetical protein